MKRTASNGDQTGPPDGGHRATQLQILLHLRSLGRTGSPNIYCEAQHYVPFLDEMREVSSAKAHADVSEGRRQMRLCLYTDCPVPCGHRSVICFLSSKPVCGELAFASAAPYEPQFVVDLLD